MLRAIRDSILDPVKFLEHKCVRSYFEMEKKEISQVLCSTQLLVSFMQHANKAKCLLLIIDIHVLVERPIHASDLKSS